MPARSRNQVCVLGKMEAHSVEQDGFLPKCRDHRHWSERRAQREIKVGRARWAVPKRIDARRAVVELRVGQTHERNLKWQPTLCSDRRNLMGLVTMQLRE